MRFPLCSLVLLLTTLAGCAEQASRPVEFLDERTGMTVGSLQEPMEMVPTLQSAGRIFGTRTSFAYLGPVEWDRSGTIDYSLWVHVAPGNDKMLSDIHGAGTVSLVLDDGTLVLTPMDAPQLASAPYTPVASWGQTAYFSLAIETLQRMAGSRTMQLEFHATNDSTVVFRTTADYRAILNAYLRDRGITHD